MTKGYIAKLIKEGRLHFIKNKLNVKMSNVELDNKSNNDKAPNYWWEKALHEKWKASSKEHNTKGREKTKDPKPNKQKVGFLKKHKPKNWCYSG